MVAGNWKMNGRLAVAQSLVNALLDGPIAELAGREAGGIDCLVCPPFPLLLPVGGQLQGSAVTLGAQNVAATDDGAYTGEVSAAMLADLGCSWTLVGHSERRTLFGETDEIVAAKSARALAADIGVIICVGETLEEREADKTESVLARQVDALVSVIREQSAERVVLAYEPVWAIGTGKTASPEMAQQAHRFIRERLAAGSVVAAPAIRLLYGGSVKPQNARELFEQADIDGGLIGGASLSAADFTAICQSAIA
ncbi:MAG: triose-phosphate isomerase [Burkholderiaceae bacterium]